MTDGRAMSMNAHSALLWVMPLDAETLGADGKQVWYATEDGAGTTVGVEVAEWHLSSSSDQSEASS